MYGFEVGREIILRMIERKIKGKGLFDI